MSMLRYYQQNLEKQICDALGLENVVSLDIHMEVGCMSTVKVVRFIKDDELAKLIPILQEYELRAKEIKVKGENDNGC